MHEPVTSDRDRQPDPDRDHRQRKADAANARLADLARADHALLALLADRNIDADAIGVVLRELVEKTETRLRRVSRLYAVSSSVNEAIVRVRDPRELYRSACRIAVEQGELPLAWIGVRNRESDQLELIARCGGNEAFVDRVFERIRSNPTFPGPAGRVWRDGYAAVANDIATDASFYWKEDALKLGLRACGVFPLKTAGVVSGIIAIYSDQPGYFSDEELRVLNSLADNISFAVASALKDRELEDHQRMLATLFDNLPGMAYRCRDDEYWTMEIVSSGCFELTGYSQASFLENKNISYGRVIHPVDRERVRLEVETGVRDKRRFEMVYRIVTAQGDAKWVWERGSGVYDAQGALRFLEGFITDVTARREAENQVAAQAALLDKAKDAIVLYGMDDTVRYWNRGAERLYGWRAGEAVGRKITALICRDTPERRALLDKLVRQGEWSGELTRLTKSGGEVCIDASWTLVRDEDGEPDSILAINTDITERKKLETQFLTTQRLESIGTLAGGIAHDFNNILAAINGNAKLAGSDLSEDDPLRTPLREIEKASLRAGDLVRQILTFSRRQEARRQNIRLADVVAEALRLLRATLPAQIEIRADFDTNSPTVAADATQIHQVVINLGTNAAYAMREHGGVLSIRLSTVQVDQAEHHAPVNLTSGRYALLAVSDSGAGMDAAITARIFEPFFTTKTAGQGTGLGLSVVHGIVRSHDGAVTVDSEPGRGTIFNVYLPAIEGVAPVEAIPQAPTALGAGQHVLYVDDEEALVFLATRVLEKLGYRVTGRVDPKQALEEFRANPQMFDAVVSDLSMPGMTGPELARAILAIRGDIPIVLTSGYIRDEDMKLVRDLGIRDLVLKPNTVEDLGAALHRVLTRH